jgi:hypothetical protein
LFIRLLINIATLGKGYRKITALSQGSLQLFQLPVEGRLCPERFGHVEVATPSKVILALGKGIGIPDAFFLYGA